MIKNIHPSIAESLSGSHGCWGLSQKLLGEGGARAEQAISLLQDHTCTHVHT